MAIFMPVTSNESQNFLTKVENPSQILNFITGANRTLLNKGENQQQIFGFGSYYFNKNNDNEMSSTLNESKKRLLLSEVMERNSNTNDSDSDVSVGQEKIDDNKIVNNYQKMKTKSFDNSTTSTRGGDDDDNSSNESSSPRFGFNNSSSRMSIPIVNQKLFVGNSPLFVTGGNPSGNLQEEILRNSQVYAGELMRHQLAAAAQLQSLSGVQSFQSFDSPMTEHHSFNFESSDSLQDKFPRLFSPKKVESNNFLNCNNKSAISFQNIHSHLSAITQITNSFTSNNNNSMKKDDVTSLSSLSRESSQSPSGFQQFKQNQHFVSHQNHNLTDRQLKFSIDNILKADFGRRITEPLLRSSKNKKLSSKIEKQTKLKNFTKTNNNESISISPNESSINNAEKSPTSIEKNQSSSETSSNGTVWPAWVFCTRYSDRPSSGRSPRMKKPKKPADQVSSKSDDEKRPRTAFSGPQLARLKHEFNENRYLTEKRRQALSAELGLNEAQIKIWFQNKRAKIKKSSGQKNPLALQLMAQGLYNHSTVPLTKEEEELQELQAAN